MPGWNLGHTQSLMQWVKWSLYPELKWQGCQHDHAPLTSAEAKNNFSRTATAPYAIKTRTASALPLSFMSETVLGYN
jgi:hypothetical protein